jgi:hypothetical protein
VFHVSPACCRLLSPTPSTCHDVCPLPVPSRCPPRGIIGYVFILVDTVPKTADMMRLDAFVNLSFGEIFAL